MRNKKKLKQSFNKLQRQLVRGTLSIIGISLIIIFIFGNHGVIELYQLSKKRQQIQKEIALLRQQKINLEKEKSLLRNDKKHIEKLAREKYRMAKPNERIFKVIEKDR
tara:strand:+ start:1656 stop:1979 length:324 start_codon:yes stop_codon:yes gene_type:complete